MANRPGNRDLPRRAGPAIEKDVIGWFVAEARALVFATRIVGVAADRQAAAIRASKLAGADIEFAPAWAQAPDRSHFP